MFIVRRFYRKNFVSDFVFNIQVISRLFLRYSVFYVFLTFFLKLFDGQNALYMSKGITDWFLFFPPRLTKILLVSLPCVIKSYLLIVCKI